MDRVRRIEAVAQAAAADLRVRDPLVPSLHEPPGPSYRAGDARDARGEPVPRAARVPARRAAR